MKLRDEAKMDYVVLQDPEGAQRWLGFLISASNQQFLKSYQLISGSSFQ